MEMASMSAEKLDGKLPKINLGGAKEVARVLRGYDSYVVVSHVRPDGDALGSTTAMVQILKALGKRVVAYNPSPIPHRLDFLPYLDTISQEMPAVAPEVTLCVDCGGTQRVTPEFATVGQFSLNIDHHATNTMFADLNWVDSSKAAVGVQMYELAKELGVEFTPDLATSILTAITTDSGGYRYSNTDSYLLRIASEMMDAGASLPDICQRVYESKTREEVTLIGRVYSRLAFDCGGALVHSELRWADYTEVGGIDHEPEGLSGDIRAIEGVELSILFHELDNGGLRANFRGKGAVDCSALAAYFGGGGHRNASGYFNPAVRYEEEKARVLTYTRDFVAAQLANA